jgi:hypothetical protein
MHDSLDIIREEFKRAMPRLRFDVTPPALDVKNNQRYSHVTAQFTVVVPVPDEPESEARYQAQDSARALAELMFQACESGVHPAFMIGASRALDKWVDQCAASGVNHHSGVAENVTWQTNY